MYNVSSPKRGDDFLRQHWQNALNFVTEPIAVPEMYGLCGWLGATTGGGSPTEIAAHMARQLPYADGRAPIAEQDPRGTVAAGGEAPGCCARIGERLGVIVGQPRWHDATLAAIARNRGDAHALLESHTKHGRQLLDKLTGNFAFVLLDIANNTALLAIDRMGIGRLCYGRTAGGGLVFATTTDAVRQHPDIAVSISTQGLFNYLFHYVSPAPRTLFDAVEKLPAGHCLEVTAGTATAHRYWQLDYSTDGGDDPKRLQEELVETLRGSVRRAAEGVDLSRTGAFLSGGLDSSTVTGMLAEITAGPARTFTIGFDLEGYDESGFAAITAEHFKTDHKLYYVTPADVFDLVPNIAYGFDEPFGNSSAVPAYFCARLARDNGVSTMFAGDGGDEIFCGNERYLDHREYEWFLNAPAPFRLLALTSGKLLPRSVDIARRAFNHLDYLNTPLPDRLYFHIAQRRISPTAIFESDFIGTIDTDEPVAIARSYYNAGDKPLDVTQRMMLLDQQLTLADNDLRKVEGACALTGVQVRYPFLDDELVAFSGRVPAKSHLESRVLRHFFKEALRNFLPPAVISKQKHGFGLPTEHWLRSHAPLRTLCTDAVAAFADRNVIRREFAASLQNELKTGSRPELVSMCWDIMILELWLQSRNLSI